MTSERQLTIPSKFCNHFSGNSSWTGLGATASGTTPLAKTNAFIEGLSYTVLTALLFLKLLVMRLELKPKVMFLMIAGDN